MFLFLFEWDRRCGFAEWGGSELRGGQNDAGEQRVGRAELLDDDASVTASH
jgi:hypothetical protein